MAEGLLYNVVVADLTVGKPEAVEFSENGTLRDAIAALRNSTECAIPIWKQNPRGGPETAEARQKRFVGILSAMDITVHLSTEGSLRDPNAALQAPVSDIVVPNNALMRQVDHVTRLGDALEIMKQGARRLLVPLTSKRFSVFYDGKWLDGAEEPCGKWCCLSREDVMRFLIGRLGALGHLALAPIQGLGAVSRCHVELFAVEGTSPARDAAGALAGDPQAAPVVERSEDSDRTVRIIGEISAFRLCKCDLVAAGWALANLSAAEFVGASSKFRANPPNWRYAETAAVEEKPGRFSTRSLDLMDAYSEKCSSGSPRPYRGRSAPLTCRSTNSLAAVMAQMLAHRATHLWVTTEGDEEAEHHNLIGIVAYADILSALTRPSNSASPD